MLLQIGPLLRLGSKCYYGWDFYYSWVQMLLQMGPLLHLCLQQWGLEMLKDMLVLVLDHFFCSSITRKGLFESVDQNHKSYVQELLHHPVTHPGGQLDKIKQYLIRRQQEQEKK